jgi:hypothetical protein
MKKIYSKITAILALGFLLGSCEENAIPERFTYASDGALVKFYNHAEASPMVNFYLNDQRVTASVTTTAAGGALRGLAFGNTYPSTYGYATVPNGSFNLIVRDTATKEPASYSTLAAENCKPLSWKALANPYRTLAQKQGITLDKESNYSAFLVGRPAVMGTPALPPSTALPNGKPDECGKELASATYEVIFTKDNLPPADFSKVYVRFMNHLASTPSLPSPNIDVVAIRLAAAATATTPALPEVRTVVATNVPFKAITNYIEVPTGITRMEIYETGTTQVYASIQTSAASPFALGRVYTIFARGTYSKPGKTTHIDFWRER